MKCQTDDLLLKHKPQSPDYIQSALIAEPFEWDTSLFMIWNTGQIKYNYLSD